MPVLQRITSCNSSLICYPPVFVNGHYFRCTSVHVGLQQVPILWHNPLIKLTAYIKFNNLSTLCNTLRSRAQVRGTASPRNPEVETENSILYDLHLTIEKCAARLLCISTCFCGLYTHTHTHSHTHSHIDTTTRDVQYNIFLCEQQNFCSLWSCG